MSYAYGDELLAFIERFEPGYAQTCKGCAPEDLAALDAICQEVSRKPLPAFYAWFQSTMGSDMGAIHPADSHLDYSAKGVLAAYAAGVVERVRGYLLVRVASGLVDEIQDHLVLSRELDGDAPLAGFPGLASTAPHDPDDETYPSLRELLAQQAFEEVCLKRLPVIREGAIYVDPDADGNGKEADVFQVLERMGFERLPITGRCCPLFWREGAAISLYSPPNDAPDESYALKFGAGTEEEIAHVLETLEDNVGWDFVRTDHIAK